MQAAQVPFVLGIVVLVGCGSPPGTTARSCVANLNTNCSPLYDPPVYSTIFAKIFQPTCAQGMGTCHTSDAAMGGLVFEDPDTAYALLLGTQGPHARVLPHNPSCSLLVEKIESTDPTFRMPPGPTPLPEAVRCDIEQWIAQGANR